MLATVLAAAVLSGLAMANVSGVVMLMGGRGHHLVHRAFSLSNRHRGATLEGQHRDRKPQEKAEKRAHDLGMVPQTKKVHQGMAPFS
jgi:hypothetical protein